MQVTMGILIPFIGTTLGAAMVFLMKKEINRKIEKMLLGFASGVMIAASVWSLLIPSIEMAKEQGQLAWVPASVGFLLGIIFLLALDYIINKIKKEENANKKITIGSAIALAVGIGIQNFPEGAIISMPLKNKGLSKIKSFWYGMLSGIVEPIAALFTILLTNIVVPILPYFLSFAAGAMIYVVVEELIPEAQKGDHTEIGTIGVAIGFIIMMILDVALG